jgi:hypothetical protein
MALWLLLLAVVTLCKTFYSPSLERGVRKLLY